MSTNLGAVQKCILAGPYFFFFLQKELMEKYRE